MASGCPTIVCYVSWSSSDQVDTAGPKAIYSRVIQSGLMENASSHTFGWDVLKLGDLEAVQIIILIKPNQSQPIKFNKSGFYFSQNPNQSNPCTF